jgi:hypothetical protein
MPRLEPMDRTEFLTQLKRQGNYVEFPPYSELWAPAPDIVANTVRLLISPSERIHYAIQFEEWTRTDDERQHDVTWYLATDTALLRVEISAEPDDHGSRAVVRCRRWPLAAVKWMELEDTPPAAQGNRSCRLTVSFGEEEKLILESGPVERNTPRNTRGRSTSRATRQ